MSAIRATAWSSGSSGGTAPIYGLRIAAADRDRLFSSKWLSVMITLPAGAVVDAPLTPSFWRRCTEIRHPAIGRWLLMERLAPWPRGKPPKIELVQVAERRFRVRLVG